MAYASGVNAYARTSQQTETGKQLEARVFLRLTHDLETAATKADQEKALLKNAEAWQLVAATLLEPENALPVEIKRNLVDLAVFVSRQTDKIIARQDEDVAVLIDINRDIIAGLLGRG
jgi:flagellar protein FlaF